MQDDIKQVNFSSSDKNTELPVIIDRVERAISASEHAWNLTLQNEARLKSLQHRMDEAEGREDALVNDIHRLNMELAVESKQSKKAMAIIKVFGSIMTAASILINIIRMLTS